MDAWGVVTLGVLASLALSLLAGHIIHKGTADDEDDPDPEDDGLPRQWCLGAEASPPVNLRSFERAKREATLHRQSSDHARVADVRKPVA
jgi:hypothetical protein